MKWEQPVLLDMLTVVQTDRQTEGSIASLRLEVFLFFKNFIQFEVASIDDNSNSIVRVSFLMSIHL